LGDWFPCRTYFLTSKASPNDSGIVIIVVIIIVGEAKFVLHIGGIIAQTINLKRVTFRKPGIARLMQSHANLTYQWGILLLGECKVQQGEKSFILYPVPV
jgi:hypothetical protein